MLLRRNGLRYQRRYLRSTSRYAAGIGTESPATPSPTVEARRSEELLSSEALLNCNVAPIGSVCGSIDELERQFLNKYEPCMSHKECMYPLQEANGLIGTTCPVGDTDPTKRYIVRDYANHSAKHGRCDLPDFPAKQERCDQPACPVQQECCDQPACPAQMSSPRHQTSKQRLPSWKVLQTEKCLLAAGTESTCKPNRSSSLNSRSPRPPLVSDIVSKNRQQTARSGTPRDSPGRSDPKNHKNIVPGLLLKDTSPIGTSPDSERSNTKDSSRRLQKLEKTGFRNRSLDSKQTTKHKQQIYQHESATEDEYKSPTEMHERDPDDRPRLTAKSDVDDSPRLSAKSGADTGPQFSGKSDLDGSPRFSGKSGKDGSRRVFGKSGNEGSRGLSGKSGSGGSPRLSIKSGPDGRRRLSGKSGADGSTGISQKSERHKKTISSQSDSKRSSAGSSTRSSPRSKHSRKSPSLAKSSKNRSKKNKSKVKKESRSSSPDVGDDEPYIRIDISPRKQTIGANDISSRQLNTTLSCLNPDCPKKSPCSNPECPRRSPCSEEDADMLETSLRETTAKGSLRLSHCPCLPSFSPGSEQTSPRHSTDSPRVTLAVKARSKLPCYNPQCPKKSPRRSPRAGEDVDANNENLRSKTPCCNPECPKKSPRSNETPHSRIPCYNPECCKRSPRKSSCVDENVCPGRATDRCKPCLTRGPVIPVYDRPPCMAYMVPPGVKDTLKDIVNKITIFGISSGTPEVGPNKPVTGPCLTTTEEADARRAVRVCDASTACSGNIEELFFNRDLKKSDASVDCERAHTSYKDCTSQAECKANRKYIKAQNESGAGSSLLSCSGGGGTCDGARAQYYHNKLLATLQILHNKDETCRVQCESLAVAESRIATLTFRAGQMRSELEQKTKEIRNLRDALTTCRTDIAKNDFSMQAQEVEKQKGIVKTLQNNLTVIEELYRECFYETAKQEEIIESLRKSCLDVRLMDKEKADRIGKLQNVINDQKWSLDRCQDIAADVETLKLEISNFLNNSNNDSGMWEREDSLATEVGEDLHDIMDQLRVLRDLLVDDCTCDLKEENERLTQIVGNMENQLGDYHQRMCAVECALKNKDDIVKKYKKLLDEKGEELESAQQQIVALIEKERDQNTNCDSIMEQLQKTQGVLQERTSELAYAERKCGEHESTINELREQLEKADRIIKENVKVRSEVAYLTQQVSLWRRQLVDSEARVRSVEAELQRTRAHASDVESCYREKASSVAALQGQLEEAHERGAQLCAEARRVVCGVRHWVRNMKQQQREQEGKINEQTATIVVLEEALAELKRTSPGTSPETSYASAPVRMLAQAGKMLADQFLSGEQSGCDVCDACKESADTELPTTSHTDKTSKQICRCRKRDVSMRDCERPSCSTAPAPVPPRRQLKMKMCENMRCAVRRRRDVGSGAEPACCALRCPARARADGTLSPTAELYERVERLQEALADGQRRWQSRGCNTPHQ